MMKDISIILPMRSGSQRVIKKNSRPFHSNGQSLFEYKLAQIVKLKDEVAEIVISTNDKDIIDQIPKELLENSSIRLVIRPDELCSSTTKVQDLISHIEEVTTASVIFWVHATSPFLDENDYCAAIAQYEDSIKNQTADSLISVNKIQQFIWNEKEKRVINTDRNINPWPNTQDLDPLYEINHAFYINSRKNYNELKDRIGKTPALYVCEGLKKIDIDWQDDFIIAQQLIPLFEEK